MSELDMSKLVDLNGVKVIQEWIKDNFLPKTGGVSCKLRVTFDAGFAGQKYTITGGDNEKYTGTVPENLVAEVTIGDGLGNVYTVQCPNDEGTKYTCEITIGEYYGRYSGALTEFHAVLHIKTDADAVVTATIEDQSYTGTADADGYCTLTVKRAGTYSITATLYEQTSPAVTAEVGNTAGATVEVTCGEIPKLVSWIRSTDSEVAEALDKARNGELDLQNDLNWKIGDTRTVKIDSFTSGSGVVHATQEVELVITSFDDYNSCGCKVQFDFKNALESLDRMDSDSAGVDYEETEMYKTTLPALANALPEWLSSRLIEFNITHKLYGMDPVVFGNKLAMRSLEEILNYESIQSAYYYKTKANRIKKQGHTGAAGEWWTRDRQGSSAVHTFNKTGEQDAQGFDDSALVAPFGCL